MGKTIGRDLYICDHCATEAEGAGDELPPGWRKVEGVPDGGLPEGTVPSVLHFCPACGEGEGGQ